jgi:ferredoxin-NADP reductase
VIEETSHAKSIVLDVPGWCGHIAGQHVDVRLTAEDGYQTERSYSIASAPEEEAVALTVERIDDGEVSPYLTEELRIGDQLELRGPVGGYFNWRMEDGGPLLLSVRSPDDLLYRDELAKLGAGDGAIVHYTFTRSAPSGWNGFAGRIDAEMLATVGPEAARRPRTFICGPTAFVESAASLLVELGHQPEAIRTERFGPTG